MKRSRKIALLSAALLSALSCTTFLNLTIAKDITGDTSENFTISSTDSTVNVTGTATSSGLVTVAGNGTIQVADGVTFSQSGFFNSDSGFTITKTGKGTLDFTKRLNTFRGTLAVQEGTVNVAGGEDTFGQGSKHVGLIVGTSDGSGSGAKLVLGQTNAAGTRPNYTNQTNATIYANGEIAIAAADTHLAWGSTLEFAGGGKISAITTGNSGPYFTIRGTETIKVSGSGAHASIGATIWSYGGETKTFNIVEADSDLTISSNIIRGDSAPTLKKTGAGKLILSGTGSNYQGTTQIDQGTVKVTSAAALGASAVVINQNGTLAWSVAPSNLVANFQNTITGTGNLYLDHASNFITFENGQGRQPLSQYLSGFTGTITVSDGTRFRVNLAEDATVLNQLTGGIVVEPGNGQFWVYNGVTKVTCPIAIAGEGGFDGAKRGAIRLDRTVEYAGPLTLNAYSSIGTTGADAGSAFLFSGIVSTNTYDLKFFHTGLGNSGNIILTGGSTGTGSIVYANDGYGKLIMKIGDTSASADAQSVTFASNFNLNNTANALYLQPGVNRTVNLTGTITGASNIIKNEAGTVVIGGNNTGFTGNTTINAGEIRLTNQNGLNTGTVTINENGKLTLNADYGKTAPKMFPGKIAGSGELYLLGCGNYLTENGSLNGYMTGYTGKLIVGAGTRFRLDKAEDYPVFNQFSELVVEPNGEFWSMTGGNTISTNITLAGYGNGLGGNSFDDTAKRGAIRLQGNTVYSGKVTLSDNASVGSMGNGVYRFTGELATAGHTLDVYGGAGTSTVYLTGDVSGNGTIRDSYGYMMGTNADNTIQLIIGDSTASAFAQTQTIAANVAADNTSKPLEFQIGENRTVDVQGTLSGAGAVVKKGAGELVLSGNAANTNSGAFTVEAGAVRLDNGATLGTGALVIQEGASLTMDADWTGNLTNKSITNSGALGLKLTLGGPDSEAILKLTEASDLNAAVIALAADAATPTINFGDEFLLIAAPSFNTDVMDTLTFDAVNNALLSESGRWLYSLESLGSGGYGIIATASDSAAVPEPASCLLLLVGLLGLGWYRRSGRPCSLEVSDQIK